MYNIGFVQGVKEMFKGTSRRELITYIVSALSLYVLLFLGFFLLIYLTSEYSLLIYLTSTK